MTKSNSAIRNPQSVYVWLTFIAVIILVYFAGLTMPLVGPDEPRYAQVAREMFERGDWVTPTLGGFHWFEKPALLYWLQIASFNLFGVSEFAARFGSALFGLGTVASLWILGRQVQRNTTNDEQRTTPDFANWLGLIAASTVGIIAFAHGASFDIILTFPLTAAMVSFYIYDLNGRLPPLLSFYFFVGLAVLAKGLVGIVFPAAIIGLYHVVSWKFPKRKLITSVVWGAMLASAVAALWYLPMYLRHGYEFIDQFFIQHHFQRYTSNKYFHPQPFYFFYWVLPLMTIPWMPFFLAALWHLCRSFVIRVRGDEQRDLPPTSPLQIFALCWIAVPLVFFSFSGSKLPGYILPAVPAGLILTAIYLTALIRRRSWGATLVKTIAGGTFVFVLVAVFFFAPRFAETDSVKGLLAEANGRGLGNAPVMMLHGVSHNAEFYASGRIVRDTDGKQKRFPAPKEVSEALNGKPGLVLVPMEYLAQLLESNYLKAELVRDNGEIALVAVYPK